MTECDCKEPGWCERHKCNKSEHRWKLCRTRPDYFDLWEAGCGPGQNLSAARRAAPCDHRGSVLRKESCPSCCGNVLIKVFACKVHNECTIGHSLEEMACCYRCEDYTAASADDADQTTGRQN